MQVRTQPAAEANGWSDTVAACGGGALLLPAVHAIDHSREDMLCVEFVEEDQVVACALVLVTEPGRLRRLAGRRGTWTLPTAPAMKDPSHYPAIRSALLTLARERGVAHVHMAASGSDFFSDDDDLREYRVDAITEFLVDLSEGADAVLKHMHKNHRKNIRRAQRDGVEIVEDSGVDALLSLRELQLSSSQRAEARADGFGVPTASFFERAHAEVYGPGIGSLLLARQGGTVVAALAWLRHGRRAQTVRSGSLPEGYRCYAMYLLYWALIERLIESGVTELNAGGVPAAAASEGHPQHGLYEFKRGFGAEVVQRHALELPVAAFVSGVSS